MSRSLSCLLGLFLSCGLGSARAQELQPLDKDAVAKIAELDKRLQQPIKTKGFEEAMPLAAFLEKLEKAMPKDRRVSLRIDEKAFGKHFPEVAKTPASLPEFPRTMSVATALKIAISKIFLDEPDLVDYQVHPDHFAITIRDRACYTVAYDVSEHVRKILPKLRAMRQDLRDEFYGKPFDWGEFKKGKDAHDLARCILAMAPNDWTPIEIEVRNGATLIARTNHKNHSGIADVLEMLRRLADLAVVMNARVVEVDRAFYDAELAPLFASSKKHPDGRLLARAEPKLAKAIKSRKAMLQSDDVKLWPGVSKNFLSLHKLIRFADLADKDKTVASGVSFSVRPAVSDDRQRMELKISQEVTELLDVKKSKVLDAKTGKEVDVETPNVRKSTIEGSIVIMDGQPIVMPVGFRSAAAKKEGRVWVMFAEPIIYIEDEQEQIRLGNVASLSLPAEEEEKKEAPKRPPMPERSEMAEQVLHAIIDDLLTGPDHKETRDYKNRSGPIKFRLQDGDDVAWPDWFRPAVRGFTWDVRDLAVPDNLELNPGHALVIRLDKFDLTHAKPDNFDTAVTVNFHNPAFMRGVWIYYHPKREGKRWAVETYGSHSP